MFVAVLVYYILDRTEVLTQNLILPKIFWLFFMIGMALRFFLSRFESMGCQKQFKKNYDLIAEVNIPVNQSWKRTALVEIVWFVLNAVIGAIYFAGIFDSGILIIIAIGYSVRDIICILFFCPFQTWFMKNRCCATCRIYNWDFAMVFTPLVFIPSWYTYSLLGCSIALLLKGEITYRLYPERFSAATNRCLDYSRCEEKLCSHKK